MATQPAAQPLVNVLIAVWNGASYLPSCLDALKKQTYTNFDVTIWDNASTDATQPIASLLLPSATIVRHATNIGMWPAMEHMIDTTAGTYILCLSVDIILDSQFIEEAVRIAEQHPSISALQPKIYQYTKGQQELPLPRTTLDTCGFGLTRSRRVVNLGHGQPDSSLWSVPGDIFGVEGAAPFFRRSALSHARVQGRLIDPTYFWYGDDLDLAWRLALYGHRQLFAPSVVAWHDRSTTKGTALTWSDHLSRIATRRAIPTRKRQLDYANVRFTLIKNDYLINLLFDAPWIIGREIATILYMLFFEPSVLPAIARLLRHTPQMIAQRRATMRQAKRPWHAMRKLMLLKAPSQTIL